MEPNTRQASESQISNATCTPQGNTPARILSSCLAGGTAEATDMRVLAQACPGPLVLVAMRPASHRSQIDDHDVDSLLKGAHLRCVVTSVDDLVVILAAQSDIRRLTEVITEKGKGGKIKAVTSLPFDSVESAPRQYDLLKYCLVAADEEGVHDARSFALPYLVSEISSNVDIESLLHPALAKLAHYDETNQSNLLNTLKVYLEYDRNAQRCANMLYLHRNSLQYRVRRIQEIAGIDLDDPIERSYLRLSFLLSS